MSAEAALNQTFAYGEVVNDELLALAAPLTGRVLDVGCGTGAWCDELRSAGGAYLVGIEPSAAARAAAETRYDLVVGSAVEAISLEELGGSRFDVIVVADVLEHLLDPWAVLKRLAEWSVPGGRLVVSVPNLRYYRVALPLVLAGRWEYAPSGVMDWTHLRWFTRASLARTLAQASWQPERWDLAMGARRRRAARALPAGPSELLAHQLRVVATRV